MDARFASLGLEHQFLRKVRLFSPLVIVLIKTLLLCVCSLVEAYTVDQSTSLKSEHDRPKCCVVYRFYHEVHCVCTSSHVHSF